MRADRERRPSRSQPCATADSVEATSSCRRSGFGTWTLVTDWWGRTDHPHAMITAALDAGINFIDTAPVYGTDGAGESILAPYSDRARRHRDHHEVRLRHRGRAQVPGPVRTPRSDWRPESIRQQCEDSLRRLGTDRIDLYQLHNPRIEPILADDLWEALLDLKAEGKVRELGVALGPAIGWVEEGAATIDEPPDRVAADRVQRARAGARPHVRATTPRAARRGRGLISRARTPPTRCPARRTPDTVFAPDDHRSHRNRDNMLDNFEKAETKAPRTKWAAHRDPARQRSRQAPSPKSPASGCRRRAWRRARWSRGS